MLIVLLKVITGNDICPGFMNFYSTLNGTSTEAWCAIILDEETMIGEQT